MSLKLKSSYEDSSIDDFSSLELLENGCGEQQSGGVSKKKTRRRTSLNTATKTYTQNVEVSSRDSSNILDEILSKRVLPTNLNDGLSISSTEDKYYSSCDSVDDPKLIGESFSFQTSEIKDFSRTKESSQIAERQNIEATPISQRYRKYKELEGKMLISSRSIEKNDFAPESAAVNYESVVIPGLEKSIKEATENSGVINNRAESDTYLMDDSSGGASIEYEIDAHTNLNSLQSSSNSKEQNMMSMMNKNNSGNKGSISVTGMDNMQREARNFTIEHRLFVKCLLDLLAQRDLIVVDMDDPDTLKCGPLRKATHIVKKAWKYKYVEIRRGMFSYYDDSPSKHAASEGDLVRMNIKLNANTTRCRAVKLNHKSLTHVSIQGRVFELSVEGNPRRFWLANSRQERSAWIRAINDAMVGGSDIKPELQIEHSGRSRKVSRKSPYRSDLALYLKVQREIKSASTKKTYVGALSSIIGHTLNVPVKWITDQNSEDMEKAFHRESVSGSVDQLWKDLARDSVQINKVLFKGEGGHAADRIIGGLTREIMGIDRTSPLRPKDPNFRWKGVSELQALSFARDILLSGNRTRSGGDSYYCVDLLCQNAGLVVLVPSSLEAEPLSITVEHPLDEENSDRLHYGAYDRCGWLKTRTRKNRKWRRKYFVLSEGTLSFYKKAHPKPYNVEGHIKILETPIYVASMSCATGVEEKSGNTVDKKRYTLTFRGKEDSTEQQIRFEDENIFLLWAYALEATISKAESYSAPKKNGMFRILHLRDEPKDDTPVGFILAENSLELHADELGFDQGSITSRGKALSIQYGGTKSPTVSVSVRASTVYRVCTLDPQGVESEDTWATISASFMQTFTILGGPNGFMNRSEEIVQVKVKDCSGVTDGVLPPDTVITPRSMARIKRKLSRRQIDQDGQVSDKADSC